MMGPEADAPRPGRRMRALVLLAVLGWGGIGGLLFVAPRFGPTFAALFWVAGIAVAILIAFLLRPSGSWMRKRLALNNAVREAVGDGGVLRAGVVHRVAGAGSHALVDVRRIRLMRQIVALGAGPNGLAIGRIGRAGPHIVVFAKDDIDDVQMGGPGGLNPLLRSTATPVIRIAASGDAGRVVVELSLVSAGGVRSLESADEREVLEFVTTVCDVLELQS